MAQKFAAAALVKKANFGLPNGIFGPLFASQSHKLSPLFIDNESYTYVDTVQSVILAKTDASIVYAKTVAMPPAVPGPVPLVGAFAAFRLSRQLRRRVRQSV